MRDNSSISFKIIDDVDCILEESANSSINLRKLSWNDGAPKYDIRKYYYNSGGEVIGKGIGLTPDGASELAVKLVELGLGDTASLYKAIFARPDFNPDVIEEVNPVEYYTSDDIFGGNVDDI